MYTSHDCNNIDLNSIAMTRKYTFTVTASALTNFYDDCYKNLKGSA